ncbi:MAG TPA: DUF5335 family protein [Candidatus Kapabacteria bacterium]|nr:DUF5335 family protein [Candidatus Kapabacteria bacterium]
MSTRKLDQQEWGSYFDRITKSLTHEHMPIYTEVRVMEQGVGSQTETSWTPLIGITFNYRANTLEVATDPIDHMIPEPSEIYVMEDAQGLPTTVEVLSAETKQVIELRY